MASPESNRESPTVKLANCWKVRASIRHVAHRNHSGSMCPGYGNQV